MERPSCPPTHLTPTHSLSGGLFCTPPNMGFRVSYYASEPLGGSWNQFSGLQLSIFPPF